MPIGDAQAFVFDARLPHQRARSLKEFIARLDELPPACLVGHLERHDFSHWLHDVFRDRPLAAHIAILESRGRRDRAGDPGALRDAAPLPAGRRRLTDAGDPAGHAAAAADCARIVGQSSRR
jgi:hypothetical protein